MRGIFARASTLLAGTWLPLAGLSAAAAWATSSSAWGAPGAPTPPTIPSQAGVIDPPGSIALGTRTTPPVGPQRRTGACPNVHVLDSDSPAVTALLTVMRDKSTGTKDFVHHSDRLLAILAEEGLARLPSVRPVVVSTPCGTYQGLRVPRAEDLVVVSIVRAGDSLLDAVKRAAPGVSVGKILIQRDEGHPLKLPHLYYSKLPVDIARKQVILVDPMLGTAGSSTCAIKELVKAGVAPHNILFLNVVSCPEGLAVLTGAYPEVTVVTAAVDPRLNEHKYLVPGLGDYGDRYFGTVTH